MEDNRLISIDAKLKEDDLLKYLMLADISEEIFQNLVVYLRFYDFKYGDSDKAEKLMVTEHQYRMFEVYCRLYQPSLEVQLMLAQNGEVKMLFDYLKHQPLSEQAVWHLFDLRREHLVNYLVRKRPDLAYEKFCEEDLDWPVELEQNKHLLKVFHDLLRACFKQSSFCKQQSQQPEWYDDRKPSEIRFFDYVKLGYYDLFKEYAKRYEVSERAYRDLRDSKDYSKLWRIYSDLDKLREK